MKLLPFIIINLVFLGCVSNQENDTLTQGIPQQDISVEEYSEHLMHHFENKNDNIIFETINVYKSNYENDDLLEKIDSIIIFFYYGIKQDNIERYNNFMKIITENNDPRLKWIFEIIETTDIELHLNQQTPSADLNDVYFTLYFSSGNIKYLDYIINIIENYYNEEENVYYYLAARSAMWAFTLNIQTYPTIQTYFANNKLLNNGIKEYIINNDPNKIQYDTQMYIQIQRNLGKW